MSVFGAQHRGHLPEVSGVALLLHAAGEGHRDDPFCDVDQVQLVAFVQRLQEAGTSAQKSKRAKRHDGGLLSGSHCRHSGVSDIEWLLTTSACLFWFYSGLQNTFQHIPGPPWNKQPNMENIQHKHQIHSSTSGFLQPDSDTGSPTMTGHVVRLQSEDKGINLWIPAEECEHLTSSPCDEGKGFLTTLLGHYFAAATCH